MTHDSDRGYRLIPTGLVVTRALTFEEWKTVGRCLMEVINRTNWAIGDWLTYGDGRGEYGQTYTEAAIITGRSFESLSQAARVSREFSMDARSFALPWSLYREALRLCAEDRADALAEAVRRRWTRDQFTHFCIHGDSREEAADTASGPILVRALPATWHPNGKRTHHRLVTCPNCQHAFEPLTTAHSQPPARVGRR